MNIGSQPERTRVNHPGFIALMSAILISLVLMGLTLTMSASGFTSRFDVLNNESKRVALGLAESCQNAALLKIAKNYQYAPIPGGEQVDVGSNECLIKAVTYEPDGANHRFIAMVSTTGTFQGAFSNMSVSAAVQDPAFSPVLHATLAVQVIVNNNYGGTKQPGDVTVSVTGTNANPDTFAGSDSGTTVTIDTGSYSVTAAGMPGYTQSASADCSGTIVAGDGKVCVITNSDVPTTATLTVIANVTNDNDGTKQPSDFALKIDGAVQASGVPLAGLAPGAHTASADGMSGYTASPWGSDCAGDGSITLSAGNNKTCIINYDDIPPPSPECADTVMMLDRTGSMSGADLAGEKTAAQGLLDLYDNLSPAPKVGVGIFGDGSDNGGLAPAKIVGILTSAYASLTSVINTWLSSSEGGTNLQSAIAKSQEEFDARGSIHVDGSPFEHVLILLSDGETNAPSGNTTLTTTLMPNGIGDYDGWTANTASKVDAVSANDGDASYIIDGKNLQSFNFAGANIPVGATINSVTVNALARKADGNGTASIQLLLETGTGALQQRYGNNANLTGSYAVYSRSMATNPFTGLTWKAGDGSENDVNNWSMKFGVQQSNTGTAVPRVTQLYVVVNYTLTKNIGPANGIGGWDEWTANIGTTVDAVATDDHLISDTFIAPSGSNQAHTFIFPGAGIPNNSTVVSVTLSAVAKGASAGGTASNISFRVENGSLSSDDNPHTLSSSYTTKSRTAMTINPLTGLAWTADEVNKWTTRFGVVRTTGGGTPSVTQILVTVKYTAPVTLEAIGTGNFDDWSSNIGDKPQAVSLDDADDTSYIEQRANTQTFNFPGANVPASAAIQKVTLSAVAKEVNGNATFQWIVENGTGPGQQNYSGAVALTSAYAQYNRAAMTTNPLTGVAWTWTEVNNWTTRFGVQRTNTGIAAPVITQVFIVVEYTVSGAEEAALAAADSAKLANTEIFTIHFGGVGGRDFLALLASGNSTNDAGISNDQSLIDAENSDPDHFFISPTASDMADIFETIGTLVCPAVQAPPTPPPSVGNLIVITHMVNDNGGIKQASDFTMNVSAVNPSQSSFNGAEAPGVNVSADPGGYNIDEAPVSGYAKILGAGCSGTLGAGETLTCTITNDDLPPSPPPVAPPLPAPNISVGSWQENP